MVVGEFDADGPVNALPEGRGHARGDADVPLVELDDAQAVVGGDVVAALRWTCGADGGQGDREDVRGHGGAPVVFGLSGDSPGHS